MHHSKLDLALCAALAVAASLLAGCYDPGNDGTDMQGPSMVFVVPDTDLSATLRDADGSFVSDVDEVHVIGGNDCPQELAVLTVDNGGDAAAMATLQVTSEASIAIDIISETVEVPAGGSADITVQFNCMATDDIEVTMDLSLQVGSRISVFEIPLTLDVQAG